MNDKNIDKVKIPRGRNGGPKFKPYKTRVLYKRVPEAIYEECDILITSKVESYNKAIGLFKQRLQ